MREYRFYVPQENIKNEIIEINGDEHLHLSKVLRLNVDDNITVLCNDGKIRDCVLIEVGKKSSFAKIVNVADDNVSNTNVTIYQALIKADKMDFIVQKCTELGVDKFVPFESEYCTVSDKGNKTDRINRIVLASCKQCGRTRSMQIGQTLSFKQLLEDVKNYDYVIFAYEKEVNSAKTILQKLQKNSKIAIIIGCEGGFSEKEAQQLISVGTKSISLGKLILRAETAAIALVSAIMYQLGEWER